MEKEKILEVKNVSVSFDREEVLKNLSFSVSKGEALAIIGPNGAGKTVLFRALLGLIPYKGSVLWRDKVLIGYVPQKMDFDRKIPLTVEEFFLLKSKNFFIRKVKFLGHLDHELSVVGLGKEILKKPLGELSGGQLQRVLISWAMLDHPDVLLFDEPTAGIDIGSEETIYNVMHRLQDERGTTIILISHDLNIVYHYASEVLCINKSMICKGKPSDVLNPRELANLYGGGGFYHHFKHND